MTLSDWEKNGWLKKHKTSRTEIINLKTLIERDLTDCNTPGLSLDWRFAIAYNAGYVEMLVIMIQLEQYPKRNLKVLSPL